MLTRDEIFRTLTEHKGELSSFGVRSLSLFGSHARGDATDDSDLDFLVEFENKSFDSYMDLKFFLEDLFGRRVDLVPADKIKPRLRDRIHGEVVRAPGL